MLDEQGRVTGYRCSPVASDGSQGNSMSAAKQKFDSLPKNAEDAEKYSFDGAIGETPCSVLVRSTGYRICKVNIGPADGRCRRVKPRRLSLTISCCDRKLLRRILHLHRKLQVLAGK